MMLPLLLLLLLLLLDRMQRHDSWTRNLLGIGVGDGCYCMRMPLEGILFASSKEKQRSHHDRVVMASFLECRESIV
jgi:hypothetical protein